MKKVISYSLIFLVTYLIFVVATMPAQFVLNQVTVPNTVNVSGVSGSIWQANIKHVSTQAIEVHDVEAKLSVISLLSLSPSFDITLGDPLKHGPEGYLTLKISDKSLVVSDANINISVSDILKNARLPIDIKAKGFIELDIETFAAGKPICQSLKGKAEWAKAKVKALDESILLGTLKAALTCEKGALVITIDDKNDLGLSYTAYMRKLGKLSGDGFIKPGDKFPENVKPALSFLGKPDSQGRYRLSL